MIRIQREDFDLAAEIAGLRHGRTGVGGVVAFVGTVRDYSDDQAVVAIELEHYPGMTEAELERIEATAIAKFAVEAILVVHRVGRLAVSEQIVLVVAVAAHRAEAFDACRYVIDHLKLFATLWKKEITGEGGHWVDACPGCQAAAGHWAKEVAPHTHPVAKKQHPHHAQWQGVLVGILTLSDSRTLAEDTSGDTLAGMVQRLGGEVRQREILPDEQNRIADCLTQWADGGDLDLILTTGGTGPGPRDVTPEATRQVTDREMAGFAELIRSEGLKQVRNAVLTRGITAWRGQTLIINLPGSKRGASHSFEVVADLIPHALAMARGGGHG